MKQHTHYERGQRVNTCAVVRNHLRTIPIGWEGTVEYERDNNVGRVLVYVLWDMNGEVWPVFREDLAHL